MWHPWLQEWLLAARNSANGGANAACELLIDVMTEGRQQSSSGSSSSSSSSRDAAALAVLQSEHTLRWICLAGVLGMLVPTMAASQAGKSGQQTSGAARVGQTQRGPQQPVSDFETRLAGSSWRLAASRLAPSLPAAYSTLLEQLGCSREVVLWMAAPLAERGCKSLPEDRAAADSFSATCLELPAVRAVHQYLNLLFAERDHDMNAQPALHLLTAAVLQWLSDMPPERLVALDQARGGVSGVANEACKHSSSSITSAQYWQQLDKQQQEQELPLVLAGYQSVARLGFSLLPKLLDMCRGQQAGSSCPLGAGSSGRDYASNSSGDAAPSPAPAGHEQQLLTTATTTQVGGLIFVFSALSRAIVKGALLTSAEAPVGLSSQHPDHDVAAMQAMLPGGHAYCCQLLQNFTRLLAETAACSGNATLGTQVGHLLFPAVRHMNRLLAKGMLDYLAAPERTVAASAGPLIAPLAAAGDASSPDAMQAWGLLCSVVKLYGTSGSKTAPALAVTNWSHLPSNVESAVLLAVSAMLKAALAPQDHAGISSLQPSRGSSAVSTCGAALPWLVLLGRCCLALAFMLQHWCCVLTPDSLAAHMAVNTLVAFAGPQPGRLEAYNTCVTSFNNLGCAALISSLQLLLYNFASVEQWLAAEDTAQQLAALGYQPQDLQQQLAEAAEALGPLMNNLDQALSSATNDPSPGPEAAGAMGPLRDRLQQAAADNPRPAPEMRVLADIQQQLQAAGRVLTSFAIPHACNNPACTNVSGPSEAQLVGGRSCICAGCRTARYCGRACQRQAWRQHKPLCKALAAAAAATAAAVGEAPAASVSST